MAVRDLREWVEYVKIVGDAVPVPRGIKAIGVQNKLLSRLSSRQVNDILDIYVHSRSTRTRGAAFSILSVLLVRNDPRLLRPQRERWKAALSRRVRAKFPGVVGFDQWATLAPEEAREFLLHYDPAQLKSDQAARYVEHLSMSRVTDPSIRDRLKDVACGRHPAAVAARAALRKVGPPSRRAVVARGRAWRRQRSVRHLSWLYYNHISRLPYGAAIQPVLAVLGNADYAQNMGGGREYIWKPADTPDANWLRLYADTSGTLRESGLK